jgi:hypothetical protein
VSTVRRPFVCVAENCPSCAEPTDEYGIGFREGYTAARESTEKERSAMRERESAAIAEACGALNTLKAAEERHRRTLEVMDAEVARLTQLLSGRAT